MRCCGMVTSTSLTANDITNGGLLEESIELKEGIVVGGDGEGLDLHGGGVELSGGLVLIWISEVKNNDEFMTLSREDGGGHYDSCSRVKGNNIHGRGQARLEDSLLSAAQR